MTFNKLNLKTIDWKSALPRLGVDPATIQNPKMLGPCPIEGEGKTRFRFVNRDGGGNWFCNTCGAGDGVRLVALVNNVSDADAIRMIRDLDSAPGIKGPPICAKPVVEKPKDVSRQRRMLQKIWGETVPVEGTSVEKYIHNRVPGFSIDWLSPAIAFHPELYHVDEDDVDAKTKQKKKQLLPAMVARVTGLDGKPVTLHRTYLSKDGFKATVSPGQVKKLMSGTRMLSGDSIRVNTPHIKSRVAIVCEGIEKALALVASTNNRHAAFSALNAGNLSKFKLSRQDYDHVIICADRDPINKKHGWRPGEHFAEILQARLLTEGFTVKFRVPETEGKDYADLWIESYKLRLVA